MSNRWTIEEYRRFQKTGNHPDRGPALRTANMERGIGDEPEGSDESKAVHQRYRINVNRHSAKLCDPDNICSKWAIDALEQAHVIPEDSPEHISSVTFEQTLCKHGEEKTVISVVTA